MVIIVGQLVEERARLQNESWQDHFRQVHARAHLLHEEPNEALVLVAQLLRQLATLKQAIK